MKIFSSETQQIGELGENIACKYLVNKGFIVVERNFTQKWGEIDIIAEKDQVIHFLEVKSVTRENFAGKGNKMDEFRAEDQVHPWKQKRLMRTIETYIARYRVEDWQFDVVCVRLDLSKRIGRVEVLSDVILGS
jgi:putative endonuclease